MTAPCSISFDGCRTRAEARERFKIWLAEIHSDNLHQLRTDLYAARDNGDLIDEDGDPTVAAVDDVVAMARQQWEDGIGTTLALFDHIIAEHLRSDIP